MDSPADSGPADIVVVSETGDRWQHLAGLPLARGDPTAQVGCDSLRWPFWPAWHAWHVLIIAHGDRYGRPVRSDTTSTTDTTDTLVLHCLMSTGADS